MFSDEAPYFDEASLVVVCKKMYAQDMDKACICDDAVNTNYGENEPMHKMYVGEIVKAYVKE